MIFSYGFLESDRTEAKQVFLDMTMPDDDPLAIAKSMICRESHGIRVSMVRDTSQNSQRAIWDSPIVWWACVNEEDGLKIGVTQTTEGARELETVWKGEQIIQSPTQLQDLLAADQAWDIFQLRANILVSERLETQLSLLRETDAVLNNLRENETLFKNLFRPEVFALVSRLRKLEAELLEQAVNDLMKQVSIPMASDYSTKQSDDHHDSLTVAQKNELIASETVTAYLAQQSQAEEVEDFS
jgi:hypothetical protein